MDKKEVILRTDLPLAESIKIADELNKFFSGSSFYAAIENEMAESMSGHELIIHSIKLIDSSKKYYFTFGTAEQFPYQCGYLIVCADSKSEAVEKYRAKYPDIDEGIINCSFIYSQEEWDREVNNCPVQYSMLNESCHEIIR